MSIRFQNTRLHHNFSYCDSSVFLEQCYHDYSIGVDCCYSRSPTHARVILHTCSTLLELYVSYMYCALTHSLFSTHFFQHGMNFGHLFTTHYFYVNTHTLLYCQNPTRQIILMIFSNFCIFPFNETHYYFISTCS